MPINPYIDLFGAGTAGAGAGVGAGAGGETAAAGFPWAIVVPIALSLLSQTGLFGETSTQRQRRMMEELLAMIKPKQEYMWSRFKEMDPIIAQALQTQLGRTAGAGWGWPEGMGGG